MLDRQPLIQTIVATALATKREPYQLTGWVQVDGVPVVQDIKAGIFTAADHFERLTKDPTTLMATWARNESQELYLGIRWDGYYEARIIDPNGKTLTTINTVDGTTQLLLTLLQPLGLLDPINGVEDVLQPIE